MFPVYKAIFLSLNNQVLLIYMLKLRTERNGNLDHTFDLSIYAYSE